MCADMRIARFCGITIVFALSAPVRVCVVNIKSNKKENYYLKTCAVRKTYEIPPAPFADLAY